MPEILEPKKTVMGGEMRLEMNNVGRGGGSQTFAFSFLLLQ